MATNNSWNQQIAAADTAITLNSGTNTVGISTDASATTVNIANGGAAKGVTLGSTNTTSSLALQCGTNNFSLASASGNIITAKAAGQLNYPLQPVFAASLSANANNVTGDSSTYSIIFNLTTANVGTNYSTSTGVFTAPVTGNYLFSMNITIYNLIAAHTIQQAVLVTTPGNFILYDSYFTANVFYERVQNQTVIVPLTAGNTAYVYVQVSGSTKVVGVTSGSNFNGYLLS